MVVKSQGLKDRKKAKIKSLERLEVQIMTFNETVVQKNWVKTLYRHGKPLEEELVLSDLAGGRTNSASQLWQEFNCRVIDLAQCLQCDYYCYYYYYYYKQPQLMNLINCGLILWRLAVWFLSVSFSYSACCLLFKKLF